MGPSIMLEDDLWHILVWPGPFTVELGPISKSSSNIRNDYAIYRGYSRRPMLHKLPKHYSFLAKKIGLY